MAHRNSVARRISALEPVDRDEIAAQRRLLCIKLEIAQGKDSPPQDRDLRMQYQLEQMNQSGLGHQVMDTDSEVERMEIDWLCMPGAAPEQQKALDQRFRRALER